MSTSKWIFFSVFEENKKVKGEQPFISKHKAVRFRGKKEKFQIDEEATI
jgi:hypothetical protein